MNRTVARWSHLAAMSLMAASVAVTIAACSTAGSTSSSTRQAAPAAKTTATPPASTSATTPAAHAEGPLSGTWNGRYSGAYGGTFRLTWHQSGTHLHGMITISNPGGTLPINGTVNGSAISFGTVGSTAITYSGTVSGNSMSGNYEIHTANGTPGGPWSAKKA
jgi:hypothetical protein